MAKIIIVEDNFKLAQDLGKSLSDNEYDIEIIQNFTNVPEQILSSKADLVLLDMNIPNISGERVLKSIRDASNLPVIMLTGRNNEIDEAISLACGADDFIAKPYNPQILLLHIEAVLKRCDKCHDDTIKYRDITVLTSKSSLKYRDQEITLTKNELAIIVYLLKNSGKIVSRADIMDHLWSGDQFVDDNTLTVNINRLRRKLSDIGLEDLIQTRRSQGYIIE